MVATLVEKAANLGGLCRTCEAFGVRELVVASRGVLQDHTFTSLALTAHRWLPITEVRNHSFAAPHPQLDSSDKTENIHLYKCQQEIFLKLLPLHIV